MKAEKILFIDTETGGLEPSKNSLLSLALVLWQGFAIVDAKEILINDGIMSVTPKALEINGINVEQHKAHALSPQDAIHELDLFLNKHFLPGELITLGGHNITFDVNFTKYFLIHNGYKYSKRFSHRTVDTSSVLYYLYLSGKIEQKAISSQEAFDLFGISVQGRHTALGDAFATAELFTALLDKISQCAE
ncbi:3'-5' exonuclease [Hymenobacter ruricola]|uniref:3'-5' exonuclease n=1 Tax=Hymenobacter ruricola TaxID=2791023 RepID=A0ABS0IBL0_9BACT|nr:3'-5' exonuclease [Hymenobacter ruricola]MBF9224371.1 3'-5' exonuclease [Hymenobacter ruricola]